MPFVLSLHALVKNVSSNNIPFHIYTGLAETTVLLILMGFFSKETPKLKSNVELDDTSVVLKLYSSETSRLHADEVHLKICAFTTIAKATELF